METKINWYIGQEVWDKTISEKSGKIENINNPVEKYPIIVNFSGFKQCYTLDGRLALDILIPTLSTKNYEITMEGFSQEVEEELPYKGQVCWGRRQKSIWFIGHFIEKEEGEYILSPDIEGINSKYYDEITTKNPYEDVSEMENTDREPQIGDMVYAWDDENPSWIGMGILTDVQLLGGIRTIYVVGEKSHWKHCSLKNPLEK